MRYDTLVRPGILEVYCGPMKCGKTLALIHRVEKLKYLEGCRYQFFKPARDTRDTHIKTRFGSLEFECKAVKTPEDILHNLEDRCDLVAIDEAQFFSKQIVRVVQELTSEDINVIISGLDLDFRGEPFGPMPQLLALADSIEKLYATCDHPRCRRKATRTQRLINGNPARYDDPIIVVEGSGKETYEARCCEHHIVPGTPERK